MTTQENKKCCELCKKTYYQTDPPKEGDPTLERCENTKCLCHQQNQEKGVVGRLYGLPDIEEAREAGRVCLICKRHIEPSKYAEHWAGHVGLKEESNIGLIPENQEKECFENCPCLKCIRIRNRRENREKCKKCLIGNGQHHSFCPNKPENQEKCEVWHKDGVGSRGEGVYLNGVRKATEEKWEHLSILPPKEERCTAGCCFYNEAGEKIGMCGANHCDHPHCVTVSAKPENQESELEKEFIDWVRENKFHVGDIQIARWWLAKLSNQKSSLVEKVEKIGAFTKKYPGGYEEELIGKQEVLALLKRD